MKRFEEPKLECTELMVEDIITVSGGGSLDEGSDGGLSGG